MLFSFRTLSSLPQSLSEIMKLILVVARGGAYSEYATVPIITYSIFSSDKKQMICLNKFWNLFILPSHSIYLYTSIDFLISTCQVLYQLLSIYTHPQLS